MSLHPADTFLILLLSSLSSQRCLEIIPGRGNPCTKLCSTMCDQASEMLSRSLRGNIFAVASVASDDENTVERLKRNMQASAVRWRDVYGGCKSDEYAEPSLIQ